MHPVLLFCFLFVRAIMNMLESNPKKRYGNPEAK